MGTPSKLLTSALAFTLWSAAAPALADTAVLKTDQAEINVGGMAQAYGEIEYLKDPYKDDGRMYLYLKEARLRLNGKYDDFGFHFELGTGPEDVVNTSSGMALGMLDMNVDVPLKFVPGAKAYVKVGQMKIPFGRERLTYSGYSNFVDRSVQDPFVKVGRDVGAALVINPRPLTAIIGVYTGGGRDVPIRYLPERLGLPMVVVRAGVGDYDTDPFELKAHDRAPEAVKGAFFINGFFTKDSNIGHSSVLNVKMADKSFLIDSNWNPAIAQAPSNLGQYWGVGADAVMSAPVGSWAFTAQAEVNYEGYSNAYGFFHVAGGQAQAAISNPWFQGAIRYGVLFPDPAFANAGVPIIGNRNPINEVTPSLAYSIMGDQLKLIADLPITFNAPVATETNVGSYLLTQVPAAEAALAGNGKGSVGTQNVVEARLMLQALF